MAVINNNDAISPVEPVNVASGAAVSAEAAFFNAKLQSLNYETTPPNLEKILSRCGVDNLIARLHTRFLQFVGSDWKKSTMASLDARAAEARDGLQALGAVPSTLSIDHVLQHACTEVAPYACAALPMMSYNGRMLACYAPLAFV